jgi:acetyl-CoA carboxylase carboxyl transferase subunit alpha
VTARLDFEEPLDELRRKIADLEKKLSAHPDDRLYLELGVLRRELEEKEREIYRALTPWQKLQMARHPDRPYTLDYVKYIFTDFVELHGDRSFADDPAIVGGPARLDGRPVMVLGHQKGRDTKEKVRRNFGMAHPEGFRKAQRLMRQAEKFGLPLISFVDTPAASPTLQDEERGQAWAIAESLLTMASLHVPVLVAVIGEGGSGGALALGVGDRILMLEHAVYSVASPEAAAAIVWKDHSFAPRAADALKITAQDLLALGVIDRIVPEPPGGAHSDPTLAAEYLKAALLEELAALNGIPGETLAAQRYQKFRCIGYVIE